ncbi:MAG: hypothetical protein PHV36_08920 [Elusimicrobiales bacterium]|nr:hypothetical protein [Elusimicrobiales bacterium]
MDGAQALKIQQPAHHQRFLPHVFKRPPAEPPEPVFFFRLAPKFFYLFSRPLALEPKQGFFSRLLIDFTGGRSFLLFLIAFRKHDSGT